MIAYTLALIRHHGVSEAVINTHHLPGLLEQTAREHCPPGLELSFSRETTLLDTGGGIRRVAGFLRESDPCLILGGDMLLDVDLSALARRHRERGDAVTMLLREDVRSDTFGSVGVDEQGLVRHIGSRVDLGGSVRAGLYTWANVVSARALDTLPEREVFSHFWDWLGPRLRAGARDVRGDFAPCTWEPVGTPAEYLTANLSPPALTYLEVEAEARRRGVHLERGLVVGAGATIGAGASLRNVVVWSDEHVPAGLHAENGVFAGGAFQPVPTAPLADA
jgi:NDP-sugar pyrophosphorylase family protein